ncbi:MAG: ABC transporter ATP-binding protein [Lachnospiraceae bacterium]
MIEVKDLVKRYGEHVAVDHLSFKVEKGQIYGFLGPNGAGKSTTMNMITGYLAANEGTVIINGHDILEEPEAAKKCIGYLPEQPPLYMDMTVKEYLTFAAELKMVQKNEREEMVENVMGLLELTEVKDRLVKNLSKGYKQRVGLGQALMGNPEILILDEPTVGLDPKQIIEIRSLIKDLSREHTVILSSHILSEVSALCDQILIISHGKLVACDTPENLSRNMGGGTTLEISILDPEQKVDALFAEKLGDAVLAKGKRNGDVWTGSLQVEGKDDIRAELFYMLADADCPILELKQTKLSLEDIFLELTEEERMDIAGDIAEQEPLIQEEEQEEGEMDYDESDL